MREEIKKDLMPLVDKFINDLLVKNGDIDKIYNSVKDREREMVAFSNQKEKELTKVKEERTQRKLEHDKMLSEFKREQDKCQNTIEEYNNRLALLQKNEQEVDRRLSETDIELKRTKDCRLRLDAEREIAEQKNKWLDSKVKVLKSDEDSLKERQKEADDKYSKAKEWHKQLSLKETELNKKEREIEDKLLQVRALEKEALKVKNRYIAKEILKDE